MGRIRQGRERRKLEDMDEGGHDNDDIKKERSGGGRGGEGRLKEEDGGRVQDMKD